MTLAKELHGIMDIEEIQNKGIINANQKQK
jgi:hypothetical protein